jgi:hypothetical protein
MPSGFAPDRLLIRPVLGMLKMATINLILPDIIHGFGMALVIVPLMAVTIGTLPREKIGGGSCQSPVEWSPFSAGCRLFPLDSSPATTVTLAT